MPRGLGWVLAALVVAWVLLSRKSGTVGASKAPAVSGPGSATAIGAYVDGAIKLFDAFKPDSTTNEETSPSLSTPVQLGYNL